MGRGARARRVAGGAACWALALALALGVAGGALAGCAKDAGGGSGEIVLTVSQCPTKRLPQGIMDEMMSRHSNLRFEFDAYASGNYSAQQIRQLEQHDIPDILINTRSQNLTEDLENNLVDLAGYDFASAYLPSVIDALSTDGRVYYLPGYLALAGFFYNKDLFAERGWDVPRSLEDLVALNERAKAEGVRLLSYSMELEGTRYLHMTDIASAQFLHTPQGQVWEDEFLAGKATMTGVFEPFLDEYQTWLDSGLITPEDLSFKMDDASALFKDGKAAMFYGLSNNVKTDEYDFEVGMAPFLAQGDGQDNGWYLYSISSYFGINKKLEEPGNEEKLAIALEMFEFMSTPEGQDILKEGGEGRYPATREAGEGFEAPLLSDYADVVARNNLVEFAMYGPVMLPGGTALTGFIEGTSTAQEVLAACDESVRDVKSESKMGDVVGRVARDMSADETVRFFAEAFRSHRGTDIGLMLPGGARTGAMHPYGISGKLYEGDLHANELTALLTLDGMPAVLATARITGADLRGVLEDGRSFDAKDSYGTGPELFRYQLAGAEVTYDAEHKVRSLTMGGREVADDDVLTVTYFDKAVDPARLSDASVSDEKPIPAATAYLKEHPAIG